MAPRPHLDEQFVVAQLRSLTCVHPVLCAVLCMHNITVPWPQLTPPFVNGVARIASQPSITPHQSELSCMLCKCKCKCCCASVSMPYRKAWSDAARLHAGAVCLEPKYEYIFSERSGAVEAVAAVCRARVHSIFWLCWMQNVSLCRGAWAKVALMAQSACNHSTVLLLHSRAVVHLFLLTAG